MEKFAKPGDFCPNEACPDYGKLQSGQQQNLDKFGKTRKGVQRYRCRTWRNLYRNHGHDLLRQAHARTRNPGDAGAYSPKATASAPCQELKGHKEDTILAWLREAARHAEQLEAVLLDDFQIKRWSVGCALGLRPNKGEKKLSRNG